MIGMTREDLKSRLDALRLGKAKLDVIYATPTLMAMIARYQGVYQAATDGKRSRFEPRGEFNKEQDTIFITMDNKRLSSLFHELGHATGSLQPKDIHDPQYQSAREYAHAVMEAEGEAIYWGYKALLLMDKSSQKLIDQLENEATLIEYDPHLPETEKQQKIAALRGEIIELKVLQAELTYEMGSSLGAKLWEDGAVSESESADLHSYFLDLARNIDIDLNASAEAKRAAFAPFAEKNRILIPSSETGNYRLTYHEKSQHEYLVKRTGFGDDFLDVFSVDAPNALLKSLTTNTNNEASREAEETDKSRFLGDQFAGSFNDKLVNNHAGGSALAQHSGEGDLLYGGLGHDEIRGNSGKDILLGGAGDDVLRGGAGDDVLGGNVGDDTLEGGAGEDILQGGKGRDRLEGGSGEDTYVFYAGDIEGDVIADSDGGGIVIDGRALNTQLTQIGAMRWRNADGFVFSLNLPQGEAEDGRQYTELRIFSPGGEQLLIEKWAYVQADDEIFGDFGITLPLAVAGEITGYLRGEQKAPLYAEDDEDTKDRDEREYYNWDATQWNYQTGELEGGIKAEGFHDVLRGTGGNERLEGLAGNDALDGGAGEDELHGGDGHDLLTGGPGSDRLYGEAGDDVILGTSFLMSYVHWEHLNSRGAIPDGLQYTYQNGEVWGIYFNPGAPNSTLSGANIDYVKDGSNTRGDFIVGGDGQDKVYGGHENDVIYGDSPDGDVDWRRGHGDTLYGMGGDDVIYGGEEDDAIHGDGHSESHFFAYTYPGFHGADIIYGGSGNDFVKGGLGEDRLYGEDGQDVLMAGLDFGEDALNRPEGRNYLYGGKDFDQLYGAGGDDFLFTEEDGGMAVGGAGNDFLDSGWGGEQQEYSVNGIPVVVPPTFSELYGDAGNDTFYARKHARMNGGSGNDRYVFDEAALAAGAQHEIADDSSGSGDVLVFANLRLQQVKDSEGRIQLVLPEGFSIARSEDHPNVLRIRYGQGEVTIFAADKIEAVEFAHGESLPLLRLLHMGSGEASYQQSGGGEIRIADARSVVQGSSTEDRYVVEADFEDVVIVGGKGEEDAQDVLTFIRLKADDVVLQAFGDDLLIVHKASGGKMTVDGYFAEAAGKRGVERIVFADEVTLDRAGVLARLSRGGTVHDDYLRVPDWGGTLSGDAGNDTLLGSAKDDVLDGGTGNDILAGGFGTNRYVFAGEFGQDKVVSSIYRPVQKNRDIRSYPGVYDHVRESIAIGHETREIIALPEDSLAQLVFVREEHDLRIGREGTDNEIVIDGFFRVNPATYKANKEVYQFELAANETLAGKDINAYLSASEHDDTLLASERNGYHVDGLGGRDDIQGSDGEDVLAGGDGDDVIADGGGDDQVTGGRGNDILRSGAGNNVFFFGRDFGQDRMTDTARMGEGKNILEFGEGWQRGDFHFQRVQDDLLMMTQNGSDGLTIKDYFSKKYVEEIVFSDGVRLSLADVVALAIQATDGDDTLYAFADVSLSGLAGNDRLLGDAQDNILNGNDGDDYLEGRDGNDTLAGGRGKDFLSGGRGSDTYVFGKDFDSDTVSDTLRYSPQDENVIRFVDGWKESDFGYRLPQFYGFHDNADDLEMYSKDFHNRIVIKNFFSGLYGHKQWTYTKFVFADGTEMSAAQIADRLFTGDEGENALYAHLRGSTLNGHGGNDRLYGSYGNDVLIGGAGWDRLEGGGGKDIYVFGRDFGRDTVNNRGSGVNGDEIHFTEGWQLSDFVLSRRYGYSGHDELLLQDKNNPDNQLVIQDYFSTDRKGGHVRAIVFDDGTRVHIDDVLALLEQGTEGNDELYAPIDGGALRGLAGDDRLVGNKGDDHLEGGAGNDTLRGGRGNDVFVFAKSWGQDVIEREMGKRSGETDRILFADVLPQEIRVRYDGYRLVLERFGSEDRIVIDGAFDVYNPLLPVTIDAVVFADETVWDIDRLKAEALKGTDAADRIYGITGSETIYGGDGDDLIVGKKLNNRLYGENGNDSLQGEGMLDGSAGNDELRGFGDLLGGDGDDLLVLLAPEWREDGIPLALLDGGASNDTLDGREIPMMIGESGAGLVAPAKGEARHVLRGGTGDDVLYGSTENDVYVFARGDGKDTIVEREPGKAYSNVGASYDVIRFDAGIAVDDVQFIRSGHDLLMEYNQGADSITVQNFFRTQYRAYHHFRINEVQFSDGSVLTENDILARSENSKIMPAMRPENTAIQYSNGGTWQEYGHLANLSEQNAGVI